MILDHVSHSQISMWLRCPRQWEFRYVKGLKLPPSGALIEGGCYHTALEMNFRQKVDSRKDMPIDDCLDIYSDEWERRVISEEYIDWGKRSAGKLKDEGASLVSEYMASTSYYVQPTIVEETIVTEIADVTFVCIPDIVDDRKVVIDHKTSARKFSQIDVDMDIQASAEAFALNRPIMFQNHVAVKTKIPKIQVVKSYRSRTDIEWWEEMAIQVLTQMKTGIAPPRSVDAFGKAGFWCSRAYCGFYDLCRGGTARMIL